NKLNQIMHSTIMDPTVGTFGGSIVEPIGVRTMDIPITMGDIIGPISIEDIIIPTPMGGIIIPTPIGGIICPIPMEDIIVRTNFRPLSACASKCIVVHKKPKGRLELCSASFRGLVLPPRSS